MNEPYDSLTAAMLTVAERLDADLEGRGWDQPATLWQITPSDSALPDELEAQADELGGLAMRFEISYLGDLHGHPYDALIGRHVADDAYGVAVSTEGWNYGPVSRLMSEFAPLSYAPSEDPDRSEVRIVSVLLRDGTAVSVVRERGNEHCEPVPQRGGGRMDAAMRRIVGLPSGLEPAERADAVVRRIVAHAVLLFLSNAATNEDAMAMLRRALELGFDDLDDDGQATARAVLDDPAAAYALAVNTAWVTLLDQDTDTLLRGAPDEIASLVRAVGGDSVGLLLVTCLEPDFNYPEWDALADQMHGAGAGWFDGGLLAQHAIGATGDTELVAELLDAVAGLGLASDAVEALRALIAPPDTPPQ